MLCVVCESYAVQLRPAVDVLVAPYTVILTIYVNLLVCYLNKPQNALCNDKDG